MLYFSKRHKNSITATLAPSVRATKGHQAMFSNPSALEYARGGTNETPDAFYRCLIKNADFNYGDAIASWYPTNSPLLAEDGKQIETTGAEKIPYFEAEHISTRIARLNNEITASKQKLANPSLYNITTEEEMQQFTAEIDFSVKTARVQLKEAIATLASLTASEQEQAEEDANLIAEQETSTVVVEEKASKKAK